MASADPYESLARAHFQAQTDDPYAEILSTQRATVRANATIAAAGNPDSIAANRRMAEYLRLNPAIGNAIPPDQLKAMQAAEQVDRASITSPALQRHFYDPGFAAIAVDDAPALSKVGDGVAMLARYVTGAGARGLPYDLAAAPWVASSGIAGLAQVAIDALPAPWLDWMEGRVPGGNPLRKVSDAFGGMSETAKQRADAIRGPRAGKEPGFVEEAISSGVVSFGQNVMTYPLAALKPAAALLGMVLPVAGEAARKGVDQGMSPIAALTLGTSQGLIEYATEKIPMTKLVGDMVQGAPLYHMLVRQLQSEIPGEQIATILQDMNEWAALPQNKDKPFSAYIAERPSAAAQTLIATIVGVGGNVMVTSAISRVADNMLDDQRQAALAQEQAKQLTDLFRAAAASKLKVRDPQTLAGLVQEMADETDGAPAEVFIDARMLVGDPTTGEAGLLNQEKLAEVLPSVSFEDAQAAALAGNDIALPIGELVAHASGTPLEEQFLQNVRASPDALSLAEAKSYGEAAATLFQTNAAKAVEGAVDQTAMIDSAERVRATVQAQLDSVGWFTPEVHEAYSALVRDFYTALAADLRVTPEQAFAAYPLRIAGVNPATADLTQGGATLPGKIDAKADELAALSERVAAAVEGVSFAGQFWYETQVAFSHQYQEKIDALTTRAAEGATGEVRGAQWTGQPVRAGLEDANRQARETASGEPAGDTAVGGDALGAAAGQEGTLAQGPRGTFSPSQLQINLLESADLSTFLHETGHFFLEVMADLSARPDAPARVAEDMARLLDWFGVKGEKAADGKPAVSKLDTWRAMSLDEQRPYHERFAEAFEQYLFEGKAPSTELQSLFGRFRSWLTSVYKSLTDFLAGHDTKLTPTVRGVFDRMLATEEAIKAAEAVRAYQPLFENAEQAGMTPGEWRAYQAAGSRATARAVEQMTTRSLRDMRLTSNVRSRVLRALQRDMAARRKAVEAEVRAELAESPLEKARAYVKAVQKEQAKQDKEPQAEVKAWREEHDAAQDKVAEEVKADKAFPTKEERKLEVRRRMLRWEVEHPAPEPQVSEGELQVAADLFGFSGPAQLEADLRNAPPLEVSIEGITDQRMLERYGDLVTREGIERAADEAVHNDARGRFIATGLRALLAAQTETAPTGKMARGKAKDGTPKARPHTVNVLVAAAKDFAAQLVARRKVRDLKPGTHLRAESRAGRLATEAMSKNNVEVAIAAQRDALVNHYAATTTQKALDEVERAVRYLRKLADSTSLPPEYQQQIDVLLDRFDLRDTPLKTIDKRQTLLEWVESQRAIGVEPELPPGLLDEAARKSYKDMTVEEFRGLVDTVKQIEHLGRLKKKLLTSKDQREFEAIRDALVQSIEDNAGGREANTREPATNWQRVVRGLREFGAAHIKAAGLARILDGGKDGGLMWETFVRAANERGDMETTMRAEATKALADILTPWLKAGKGSKATYHATVKRSLTREQVLVMALNTGNESNLQRLLGGEGWSQQQLDSVLRTLTRADWQTVQAIWDYFETLRPLIAEKQKRVYGVEPKWIEHAPRTVDLPDGSTMDLRGGYYPVKYDPSASVRAEEHADAEGARRQLQGAYGAATTRRSFTKARAEEVHGRPLLYTLAGVYDGVTDVIHDLSWHEWLIDVNRLLKSEAVDGAIRKHYGPEAVRQFKTWRDDIAEGDGHVQAAMDRALGRLRQGVSVAGLGFNLMSALIQPLGLTQTIVRIGPAAAARGIRQFIASPIESTKHVYEASAFMENRWRTRFRELNELRNTVQGESKARAAINGSAYWLMMRMQQMVDVPTWLGAYEKAIAEGNDEARARALADQAVIDAQGSGMVKDQSAIERGGPAQKLFTVFYSFMNTAFNLGAVSAATRASKLKIAADMLLLYTVPAILTSALKDALTPGDAGDDDEAKLARKLAAEQLSFLMGQMVLMREFAEVGKMLMGEDARDYQGPAGLRLVADSAQLAKQTSQGEFDDAFRKAFVNVMGALFALPAAQINRTVTGFNALREGKTQNPAALALGYQEPR